MQFKTALPILALISGAIAQIDFASTSSGEVVITSPTIALSTSSAVIDTTLTISTSAPVTTGSNSTSTARRTTSTGTSTKPKTTGDGKPGPTSTDIPDAAALATAAPGLLFGAALAAALLV